MSTRSLSGAGLLAATLLGVSMGALAQGASAVPSGPLPVWIAHGPCEAPGALVVRLTAATTIDGAGGGPDIVQVSVTELPDATDVLVGQGLVLLAGGSDAESAVVCGELLATRQDGRTTVVALGPRHGSTHTGVALLAADRADTLVQVVVVSPADVPEPSVVPSGSPTPASLAPDGSGLSPVRSAIPGTSGAPPFSPLPAGSTSP